MLGTPSEKLSELIVKYLASCPGATARELREHLRIGQRLPSIQAVHQELRKLLRLKVVVKDRERFSLRLGWILPLNQLFEQALARTADETLESYLNQRTKKSQRWEFRSLEKLVRFWTELCLRLLAQSKDGLMCEFVEHVWFHLVATEELQFLDAIKYKSYRYLLISSGDTPLDRSYRHVAKPPHSLLATGFSPFAAKRGNYFTVIDDFVVRAQISSKMRNTISSIYTETKSLEQIPLGQLYSKLNQRGRFVLRLRHDPQTAKVLRRQFLRFFGER